MAGLAVKCGTKFLHVRSHAVGAILLGRMRIDRRSQALVFVAFIRAPALPVGDEEALLWR
jgi:hypothetical protein